MVLEVGSVKLAPMLREAVRTGEFGALGEHLGASAVLDASSERGRDRIHGPPDAIVEHLSALERPR